LGITGNSIFVDPSLNIYTTGFFSGKTDFDPDTSDHFLTTYKDYMFVHKLARCKAPSAPLNHTPFAQTFICNGTSTILTASGKGTLGWYSPQGKYLGAGPTFRTPLLTESIQYDVQDSTCMSSLGRMSIWITVQPPIDTTVTVAGMQLRSSQHSGNYQWINCLSGNPILGATGQSLKGEINGSYKVVIMINTCKDTSDCYTIKGTDIAETQDGEQDLLIYPNPGQGSLTISSMVPCTLHLINQLGTIIRTIEVDSRHPAILNDLNSGVYYLQGQLNSREFRKIVVIH
jgi:hypothetical protein